MSNEDPNLIPPETQQQRWLKYGGNVVLVSVIVIALAVLLVWVSERKGVKRWDTTAAGLYSLKPQTIAVIKPNKQPITIISLFTKAKQTGTDVDASSDETSGVAPIDKPGVVSDLLDEYRSQGSDIKTEVIDPELNPGKADDLLKEVIKQYGGEVDKYKSLTDSLPDKYDGIIKLVKIQSDQISAALKAGNTEELTLQLAAAVQTLQQMPAALEQEKGGYSEDLKKKVPDYKKVTDDVASNMQKWSGMLDKVSQWINRSKDDKSVAKPLQDYMANCQPALAEIKKQADDLANSVKGLGDLKLDTLRDALRQRNCILVRGNKEWRLIPYEKIWKTDTHRGSGPARPQFAGEQMITTAILSLNQPSKPKICFIRAGGPPMAEYGGRLNAAADRMRDYNFEVTEKDLSGTWAMQAMQQQQQPAPEPSDQEIDDAVWVVDGAPAQQNPMMGGPPPSIADKVAQHIQSGHHYVDGKKLDGGSALVLLSYSSNGMDGDSAGAPWTTALLPWGIRPHLNTVAVHQFIENEGAADTSIPNMAQHTPFIFTVTQWGDHPITAPIQSLMGLLLAAAPIEVVKTDGVTATPLIPVPGAPSAPECWGAVNLELQPGVHPKFDKTKDMAAPLYAGAVAERGGQRLVCMGSEESMYGSMASPSRDLLDYPDQELGEQKHIYAPQFPGDGEFIMNSVFWLSHQETMIAISPAAMNVSRISEIKPATLRFWHIGVLLIGLPGLVVAAGAFAYYSRQD